MSAGTNGNSIYKFDPFGNATLFTNTALAGPTGISFDATGNLFVANVQSRRIQKFDPSGQGSVFVDNTGLDPYGAAFDSAGNLYVALWGANTIEKYDSTGQGSVFGNVLGKPYAVAVAPSIQPLTPRFETESLTVSTVYRATHSIVSDSNLSGGKGTQLNATGKGQYVTYTVPVSDAGTYKVRVSVKTDPKQGIFKLSVGGVTQGNAQDEYTPAIGYSVRDLGTVTFLSSGNKPFTFQVTGKNAKSSGYSLAFDYIELIPTNRLETESLKVAAKTPPPKGITPAQWFGVFNATAASEGSRNVFRNATAPGQFITYTVPVAMLRNLPHQSGRPDQTQ